MKYVPESEALAMYDEMLDEFGVVEIGNLKYDASYVLKQVDEIAYRCGFNDWCDAEDITTDEDEADDADEGESE